MNKRKHSLFLMDGFLTVGASIPPISFSMSPMTVQRMFLALEIRCLDRRTHPHHRLAVPRR